MLEAKDQLGGRILTKPHGHGVVELAANSIHGVDSDNSVYSLATEEGLGDLIIEGGDSHSQKYICTFYLTVTFS